MCISLVCCRNRLVAMVDSVEVSFHLWYSPLGPTSPSILGKFMWQTYYNWGTLQYTADYDFLLNILKCFWSEKRSFIIIQNIFIFFYPQIIFVKFSLANLVFRRDNYNKESIVIYSVYQLVKSPKLRYHYRTRCVVTFF